MPIKDMEPSAEAKKIISQAAQWTFEGDCSLLQWMQEISKNLEQHVSTTSKSLDELGARAKRACIALDNAANSLTALQYTQFVESRCHDDDETIANSTDKSMDVDTTNDKEQLQTSTEMLKTFLQNNLQMLNRCHEKYALDFEDSDEEDVSTNKCIYQPKNPYNDRPLPHIYNSKLWKENWHVGLCDGANDYSGDEISEAFSESSNSTEDNESYESNSAHISEWASATSMLHEKYPANIAVNHTAALPESHLPLCPEAQRTVNTMLPTASKIAAGSDNSYSELKNATTQSANILQRDIYAALQHSSPTLIQPSISIPAAAIRESSQGSSDSSSSRREPLLYQHADLPPNDIFADSTMPTPVRAADVEHKPVPNSIKRKPVNLFDDDDFNSFMSEIVDKAQTKGESPVETPRKSPTIISEKPVPLGAKKVSIISTGRIGRKSINLFDSRGSSPEPEEQFIAQPAALFVTTETLRDIPKRTAPLNLFDSPEASPTNDPRFLTPMTTPENNNTFDSRPKITPKSLFDDDDDDDDDFLNVFGSRKISLPTKSIGKTLLFDDEEEKFDALPTNAQIVNQTNKHLSTDNTDKDEQADFIPTKKQTLITENKKLENVAATKVSAFPAELKQKDLFADDQNTDQDIFGKTVIETNKSTDVVSGSSSNSQILDNSNADLNPITVNAASSKIPNLFEVDLFSDIKEEENILFEKETMKKNVGLFDKEPVSSVNIVNSPNLLVNKSVDLITAPKDKSKIAISAESNIKENDVTALEDTTQAKEAALNKSKKNIDEIVNSSENLFATAMETNTSSTKPLNIEIQTTKNVLALDEGLNVSKPDTSAASTSTSPALTPLTSSAATNYASIFLDEPPDDDDFFQSLNINTLSSSKFNNDLVQDFYEPSLPTPPPTTTHKETTCQKEPVSNIANDYGGLRLFSEVPPDDDADNFNINLTGGNMSQSKNLHNVFYDDLNETLEAAKQSKELKLPQHSLFDHEPPMDNENFDITTNTATSSVTSNSKQIEKNDFITEQNVGKTNKACRSYGELPIDNMSKPNEKVDKLKQLFVDETDKVAVPITDKENPYAETVRLAVEKPQKISKLPKLNINVQALLPNAGGGPALKNNPQIKTSSSDNSIRTKEVSISRPDTAASPTTRASVGDVSQDGSGNILTSLCKNRVRVPVKRRPSTRRGRQENYRQSLIVEDQEAAATPQQEDDTSTLPTIAAAMKDVSVANSIQKIKQQTKTTSDLQNESPRTSSGFSASFLDDVEDDKRILFGTKPAEKERAAVMVTKSLSNLFLENPPADSDFPQLSPAKKQENGAPVAITKSSNITNCETEIIPKRTTTNLFSDPDENDDVDDLFEPRSTKTNLNIVEKTSAQTIADISQPLSLPCEELAVHKLQIAINDNAVNLLAHIKTKTILIQPTLTTPEATNVTSKHDTTKAKTPLTTAALQQAKSTKSLFSDAESDSDDNLFKSNTTASTKKPTSQSQQTAVTKKVNKLFGSDNDDNDFLGAFSTKSNKPKSKEFAKKAQEQESRDLFGDVESDDDDDLFNSKAIKATTKIAAGQAQRTQTTIATTAKPTKTNVQDNPLADLLM